MFKSYGALVASIYLRQPASLRSGVLELRREAAVGRANGDSGGFDCEALRIGGVGSSLTEEEIAAERSLSLPESDCLVFPLAAGQFLVGILVVEGFVPGIAPLDDLLPLPRGPSTISSRSISRGSGWGRDNVTVLASSRDDEDLGRRIARSAGASVSDFISNSFGGSWSDTTTKMIGAADAIDYWEERALLLTASALSAACAMELRAVLGAARDSDMRETLSEMQQSSSAMRTFGAMLVPRLPSGNLDRDMAEAMVVQGGHISTLVGRLRSKLQPSPSVETYPLRGLGQISTPSDPDAAEQPTTQRIFDTGSESLPPSRPAAPRRSSLPSTEFAALREHRHRAPSMQSLQASNSAPPTDTPPWQSAWAAPPRDSVAEADARSPPSTSQPSNASGQGGGRTAERSATPLLRSSFGQGSSLNRQAAADGVNFLGSPPVEARRETGWIVLRSIDDSDELQVVSEGDSLVFNESDCPDGDEDAPSAVELLERPVRRQPADYEAAVADLNSLERKANAARFTKGGAEALQTVDGYGFGGAESSPSRRDGAAASCNVLDVLAPLLIPVVKMCEATRVELTLCSPALISRFQQAYSRGKQKPGIRADGSCISEWVVVEGDVPAQDRTAGDASEASQTAPAPADGDTTCRQATDWQGIFEGGNTGPATGIDATDTNRAPHVASALHLAGTAQVPEQLNGVKDYIVSADRAGLTRALSHVLDSSLQRTGRDGRVIVSVTRSEEGVVVEVKDTGTLMAEELAAQMQHCEQSQKLVLLEGGGACSAGAAMHRLSLGMPVGTGAMSLQMAARVVADEGGCMTVDMVNEARQDGAFRQWICTRVKLPYQRAMS